VGGCFCSRQLLLNRQPPAGREGHGHSEMRVHMQAGGYTLFSCSAAPSTTLKKAQPTSKSTGPMSLGQKSKAPLSLKGLYSLSEWSESIGVGMVRLQTSTP
jgi:hypothetical protein